MKTAPEIDGGEVTRLVSAPTTRLLFGPLPATDARGAVVRRLRAAIGLGLLSDGDRLPKEADLAAQLDITTFSLREALSELRAQGLLITRAGKYGGSFVTHPPESEDLEREELIRLSAAELRDLGDWRQMLAGHSAALAAARGSSSNFARLETYASRVSESTSSQEARRAHGRFHVELASAAQSMRMTRAEFGVHEEIDWLFGLALQTRDDRAASSQGLLDIASAVRSHDVVASRAAAERYSARLVGELARLRLDQIASMQHGVVADGMTLEERIATFVDDQLVQLRGLAEEARTLLAAGADSQELKNVLSVAILQRIALLPAYVNEMGVLAEVGAVRDRPYWMVAWLRTDSGPQEDKSHVMDPSREDFYDYENREYMAQPRERRQEWAAGPYVDYGGADDYIITVAVPIIDGSRFLGIAQVDFLVGDLEPLFAPWLANSRRKCVLVNWEDRVLVSNAFPYSVGDVVPAHAEFERQPLPHFGWKLLTSPE